jgi:hypothetical protein
MNFTELILRTYVKPPLILFIHGIGNLSADENLGEDVDFALGAGYDGRYNPDTATASEGLITKLRDALTNRFRQAKDGVKNYGARGRVPVLFREKFPNHKIEAIQLEIRCRGYRDSVENIDKLVNGLTEILTDTGKEGFQDYFTRERTAMPTAEIERRAAPPVEIEIKAVKIQDRFRKNVGNLAPLMESIKSMKLLHPIVVTHDMRLVVGQRRLEACRRLGWTHIPARILDLASVARAEYDENVVRMDFSPIESVRIYDFLEAEYKAEADERKADAGREAGKKGGRGKRKEKGGAKLA